MKQKTTIELRKSARPAIGKDARTGLRERQQRRRRREIREAARELFLEKGYVETTVEMIADRALVSPPTVYNYFETKAGLLLSIIAESDKATVERSERSIKNPTGTAEDEITKLLALMVKESLKAVDEATWRNAYSMTITDAGNKVGSGYIESNSRLYDIIDALLLALIAQGKLNSDVDIHALRSLLERLNHALFAEIVAEGGITFKQYRDKLLPTYVRMIVGQYT